MKVNIAETWYAVGTSVAFDYPGQMMPRLIRKMNILWKFGRG